VIIYDFRCELEHRFEGWFSSPADCERQVEAGQVRCPVCESASVARVPSVLHVKSAARAPAQVAARPEESPARGVPQGAGVPVVAGNADPAHLREVVERLRQWVASTENVGAGFADEARRIHNQEAPERPIRGVATTDEARALHDEGIPVLPLPPHLVDKLH
jgi:hypothetical protein